MLAEEEGEKLGECDQTLNLTFLQDEEELRKIKIFCAPSQNNEMIDLLSPILAQPK